VSVSTEFLVTALVVALVPGTGAIYTVSTGLFVGRRASFFAALGGTLGIVPHLAAAILGLSALVHTEAEVFRILKFAGVAYLEVERCPTLHRDGWTWVVGEYRRHVCRLRGKRQRRDAPAGRSVAPPFCQCDPPVPAKYRW